MEITKEQIKTGLDKAYKDAGQNAYFGNGFEAGVAFALKQVNVDLGGVDKRIFLVEFRNYKEEKEWRDCFIAENETDTAQQIREKYNNKFTSYQIVDSYVY
jgi:hypothetical protein